MATLRILCKRHGVQLATVGATAGAGSAEPAPVVVSWLEFDPHGVRLHRSIRELLALDDARSMRDLGLSQPVRALKVKLEARTRSLPLDELGDDGISAWCSACGERYVMPVAGLRARHAEAVRTRTDAVWRLDERAGREPLEQTEPTLPAAACEALALLTAFDLEQLAGLAHEAIDATTGAGADADPAVIRELLDLVAALDAAGRNLTSAAEAVDELRPSL